MSRSLGRCLTLTVLLLLPFCLMAKMQDAFRLSPENGLSQGHVNRLHLDAAHQLWLATDGGLDRFDGYQSRPVLSEYLPANTVIYDMHRLNTHQLHLATSQGLVDLDLRTGTSRMLQQPGSELTDYSEELVYLIRQNKDGQALYADSTRVFTLQDGQQHVLFTLPSIDIHRHFIRDVLSFNQYLVIATSQGLWLHDQEQSHSWQLYYLAEPARDQLDSKALAYDNEQLYIGTVQGLYAIDTKQFSTLPATELRHVIRAQTLLADHNIWRIQPENQQLLLGTNHGLKRFDATSHQLQVLFQPGQTRFGYFDNSITDFIRDKHDNFWLATRGDGVYYWQYGDSPFRTIENTAQQKRLSHPLIYALHADTDALWIGSQNGLNRLDLSTNELEWYFVNPDDKAIESASTFYNLQAPIDSDALWLMHLEGISLFSRKHKQMLALPDATQQVLSQLPFSMKLSPQAELFVHNQAGLFRIGSELDVTQLHELEQRFAGDWASHWVGVHPLDPEQMLFYDNFTIWSIDRRSLAVEPFYQLPKGHQQSTAYVEGIQVRNDSIWILFHGLGLVELDKHNYQTRQTLFGSNALPTSILYQLQLDKEGMLWMSSHSGLWRFNPELGHFRQFTSQQGLGFNEFNGLSSTQLPDGRLAFGGVKGLVWFDPSQLNPKQIQPPQLYFSHLSLFSRELPPLLTPVQQYELALQHDDYGVQIHLSTFSYRQQTDTSYHIELAGPSRIPPFTSKDPYLLLPQLLPGNYQLIVTAFDPITEQQSAAAVLSLNVAYAPWTSPQARLLYLALLLAMLVFWLHWRQQQKHRLIQQNKALQQSKERLQLALDIADSDVWSWSATDNNLQHPKRQQLLALPPSARQSFESYVAHIHPDDKADYLHGWKELSDGLNDHFQQVYRVQDAEQKWHWFKDIGRVTQRGPELLAVSGIYTNITAQKLTEQELEQLIHFDSLTQLPNRSYLLQQIDSLLQSSPQSGFSLLFIDLDRFKHINDSMGHEHGNTLLQVIAARLQSQLLPGEILAHLGSDEFVYVMLSGSQVHIAQKSDALHSLIAKPLMLDQQLVSISCSIGISCYPQHGTDSYELLKFADIAMAYAKRHGEMDYAIFEQTMPERTKLKMQLEYQLKQAIQRQELQNYYQPIVDSQQQKTVGVELLLRWNNQGRMVPPDQFIPMAEELDLMAELTWGSVQRALHDLQRWHQMGFALYLSVNLSASQLSSELLASRLQELIQQQAIDPAMLRLEITESSLMKNRRQAIDNMQRLKQMGIQLYLDDFGTGYSSLTYLKDFPIDLIKIDRSFVSDVQENSQNAILNTIIALARNMQLPCIAEGVETEYQLSYLQQQGCYFIQGYWYSPPLPKERLEQFLR
ncbi:EAL domain-containing protein [Alkalimonas sp.]|uniref:EAL domain-containing protein n=1 Tax=Alkalimonas sp. TaxID=1872453 RepID=UPI00263BE201|nr:EAL domain-containing protein [Alkalimonas sp.]MCC5827348.1 EAL domain-containing protein [Alkalimonas sp.]